jgi:hypothetical protein
MAWDLPQARRRSGPAVSCRGSGGAPALGRPPAAFQRRRRALDWIALTLVAEDPRLESRFALFARLTQHEAIPGTEQVSGRLQRFRPGGDSPS